MMLIVFIGFMSAGFYAFRKLNIEAYPDPAPPIIEVITQSAGQSAEEMERYITIPIEIQLAGMPGMQNVRSSSLYGLSDIRVMFSYDTTYNDAVQQVLNRLNSMPPLPNGVQAQISPESPIGEIYRYKINAPEPANPREKEAQLTELKTLQDWVLQRRFKTIPGVVDVVGYGGLTKEYHIDVDLNNLYKYKITLAQIIASMSNNNLNVGARTLDIGAQAVNVRGMGLIRSLKDIENIVLAQTNGTPVLMKDVAHIEIGNTQRLGIVGKDNDSDVVQGIVLMRRGEKTMDVLSRIESEVDKINKTNVLPKGVQIVPYYNRRDLIGVTTHTVYHNIVFGVILVFLIQYLFLGNLRTAIIVATTIPFALFFSAMIMYLQGGSANLLSLGAIDFGIIVDATVIIVENIFRHLAEASHAGITRSQLDYMRLENNQRVAVPGTLLSSKLRRIYGGAAEVSKSIFFSTAIIVAAFLPLFTMQGVEGQIFGPMARTYGYALCGALLATFTVAPMLSALLLPEKPSEKEPLIMRLIMPVYTFVVRFALNYRVVTMIFAAGLIAAMAVILPQLGTEFLPKLDEGNLWIRGTLPPSISLDEGTAAVEKIRTILGTYPEVETVVSQHGRPDDGTDPTGFFNSEYFVTLKPYEKWPSHMTKAELVHKIETRLKDEFAGIDFNFSQNIEDNVEEAVSGVKGENSVKLFGDDLKVLEDNAAIIKAQLQSVRGITDVGVFTELGQPNLLVDVDRERCAKYGLATGDVNAIVQAAIGGQSVTDVYEKERHFPLVARLMPQYRGSEDAIKAIQVPTPSGAMVPLSELCDIGVKSGASYINRQNNERYIQINFIERDPDLGSAVEEAQAKMDLALNIPTG